MPDRRGYLLGIRRLALFQSGLSNLGDDNLKGLTLCTYSGHLHLLDWEHPVIDADHDAWEIGLEKNEMGTLLRGIDSRDRERDEKKKMGLGVKSFAEFVRDFAATQVSTDTIRLPRRIPKSVPQDLENVNYRFPSGAKAIPKYNGRPLWNAAFSCHGVP